MKNCFSCKKDLQNNIFKSNSKVCNDCEEPNKKTCNGCKEYLPKDSFHKDAYKCKPCTREYEKKRRNPEGIPTRYDRVESQYGKDGKVCIKCNDDLLNKNFENGRFTCKKCKTKQTLEKNKENSTKVILISEKECKTCLKTLPIDSFEKTQASGYRTECSCCRKIRRSKEEVLPKEVIISKRTGQMQVCMKCNIEKDVVENFTIHTNNFRNICKRCYNDCGYDKVYRARKRLENNEAFVARNTETHRKWVERNLEHCKEYMKMYSKSIGGLLANYSSSDRYVSFTQEFTDIEEYKIFVEEIISDKCFYCGSDHDTYYNGIDKIDSSKGYTKDNTVTCCSICNYMKNTMDVGSFLRKVREIAIFNKDLILLGEEFCTHLDYHPDIKLIGGSTSYDDYKFRAKKKKITFDFNKEIFQIFTKSKCYLCGVSSESGIGIDRKDNDLGYAIENSFPCCSYCNYMKKCHNYEDFLSFIKNITTCSITPEHDNLSRSSGPKRSFNLKL